MSYEPGDRVIRLEARERAGASVLSREGDDYLIAYDEGGEGWWPALALAPAPAAEGGHDE
ncbi:hypothetical protein [Zavarzinia aquatilis]|uniref:SH3 domain-containing protein n=1 Tax=Zavarzinia aquatilis TaxID=2211142 RepID=A0A317E978_9PROT|nr:hypothetical protein [Zavarzinia aquatilis]PWR22760.1 hypothetical protein DKG74_10005 [Zavarzinia aquatilis]